MTQIFGDLEEEAIILCYGPSYTSVLVVRTRPAGATGTGWHNGTG